MKYLQKIATTYYIVLRFKNKIFKKTLRTSNIKNANIRKIRVLDNIMNDKKLPNYMKAFNSPLNDMLKVITIIEDGDDIEESKKKLSLQSIKQLIQKLTNLKPLINSQLKQ